MSEPSTQTFVWVDLTIRTFCNLPHRFHRIKTFLRGIEMGETEPDTSLAAIDPLVDERGTVKAGTGNNTIRFCQDVAGFIVIHVPDIEGYHREIGILVVEDNMGIPGQFPDHE